MEKYSYIQGGMKHWLLVLFLSAVALANASVIGEPDPDALRKELFELELNPEEISVFLEKLESIEDPSPQIIAYKGSTCAFLARYLFNPFKKIYYLNKSQKYLNRAVRLDPDNVEIRFLRFLTQSQIPAFFSLGYDVKSDKKYIIAHLDDFKLDGLAPEIVSYLTGFLQKSRYCTLDEANMIAAYLGPG